MSTDKKVFVSGCFDLLHSGHVKFLSEAAKFGQVIVGIGSDDTVNDLKGRFPINNESERKYMLESLRSVSEVVINSGSGVLDFEPELRELKPDVLVVNEDGNSPGKESLCEELSIDYKVMERIPGNGLPARSTTSLRDKSNIPYRIDLAGGWLDQPFVSKYYAGPVITIGIEPTLEFNERSGMASSTRRKAIELWGSSVPAGDKVQLAKVLFSYENPPGTKEVSGSQDALGIVLPGLNRLFYNGKYWPKEIESKLDDDIIDFLEQHINLLNLGPRADELRVTSEIISNEENAKDLAIAAEKCWQAIINKDLQNFGESFREAFEAQIRIFPAMMNSEIEEMIEKYKDQAIGWKLSGAGGGGYMVLISQNLIPGTIKIKIRKDNQY